MYITKQNIDDTNHYEVKELKTKRDHIFKNYFKDKFRYADMVNGMVFQGKQCIHADDVTYQDSDASALIEDKNGIRSIGRTRDLMVRVDQGEQSIFLGLEVQTFVDYNMPFRTVTYDTITYNQQFSLLDSQTRQSFHPIPVASLVLYTGETKWVSPYTFKERMSIPNDFIEIVNDWKLFVYDIKNINPQYLQNEDNRIMVETIQKFYSWDKNLKAIQNIQMSREVAVVVATAIGCDELRYILEEQEEVSMCKAIRELMEESELKGAVIGKIEGKLEGIREGKLEGIREGIREGKLEGRIEVIQMILKQKLGNVSELLLNKLAECSLTQLDALVNNILGIKCEQDVLKLLS